MINVLILSAGTRNKIVQYFKESLTDAAGNRTGTVVATDMSKYAPALYEADKYYIVPRITEPGYIDRILDICKKENIKGVLSLIDPELSLLAENEDRFKEIGVTVVGSSYDLCELCLDKFSMFQWLKEHGYNCAESFISIEDFDKSDVSFPVFVKPVKGSASLSISKANNREELIFLFNRAPDMMIQEFLDGQEIGADVYIDLISKEVVSIFTKKKLVMRAGETDKAISFKDEKLFKYIEQFVNGAGFAGQIDIDLFEIDGKYYISEVNPRFGGGYPFAKEANDNSMEKIVNNLKGFVNKKQIGIYNDQIVFMKFNEIACISD